MDFGISAPFLSLQLLLIQTMHEQYNLKEEILLAKVANCIFTLRVVQVNIEITYRRCKRA